MDGSIAARLATWVAGTEYAQIPRRVIEEAKNQILSMIAAVHAGHFSDVGRMASRTVKTWAAGKEATLIPSGEKTSVHYAVFGNSALSMALDYDDYLFGGHTGHSSVFVSLAMAEKLGSSGRDFLLAQVLANEIGGRVGVSVLGGPVGGELASFVHLAAGAVATAKLMKLGTDETLNAIGLALAQPNRGLPAAYYGSDAKVALAAATAPIGIQAAELAANGFCGASDVLESEQGFLRAFSRDPLYGAFSGLGKVWLTETLCYKVYPCAAYVGAVVDCVLNLARQHHLDARKVRAVHVSAGPATLEMDAMASPRLKGPDSLAAVLTFSVAYNTAVALIDKELSPRQLSRDRIKDPAVWELAGRVHLSLDPEMAERVQQRSPIRAMAAADGSVAFDLESADLTGFRMGFGARVRIETEDGRSIEMIQESPYGGGTRTFEDRSKAVEDKFRRETRYTLRKERMEKAIDLVYHMEEATSAQLRELIRLCCSDRG